ncbi:hypothetical protein JXA34_02915 [Patescibacteria group bacterium]|nr:hypothetical protein [Patescibacteria group bacterium]
MTKNNQKGIGLVEVIAALGISVVVITSLVALTIFTLRSSQRSKIALESQKQANKMLEVVRAFRDSVEWAGEPDRFLDILQTNGCHTSGQACKISTTGDVFTVSNYIPQDPMTFTPEQVDTYFTAVDAVNGGLTPGTTTILRVSVYSVTRVGNQVKTHNLYTDLTNWREN